MLFPRPFRRLAGLATAVIAGLAQPLLAYERNGLVYTTDGSQRDVQAAIDAAKRGATVRIPPGTFTWGTAFRAVNVTKPIRLLGSGPDRTTINLALTGPKNVYGTIQIFAAAVVGDFKINAPAHNNIVPFAVGGASGWRITHVTYDATDGGIAADSAYFCFVTGSCGLIDHCTITGGAGNDELIFTRGPENAWQTPDSAGTANAVYVEDCTFLGHGYVCDFNSNARAVVRYCTIAAPDMKIDGHGLASNTPHRSCREIEVYRNTWTKSGAAAVEIRGGTGFLFDNQAIDEPPSRTWFLLVEYGCLAQWPNFGQQFLTPADYPIPDQIGVGEDPRAGGSDPMYLWNNRAAAAPQATAATVDWTLTWKAVPAAAIAQFQAETGNPAATFTLQDVIKADRDYFKETVGTAFDGSSGVGRGTTAQMRAIAPTKVGVGFWVTDQGTWNRSGDGQGSGELYVWNGHAWALKYVPYTYPHPLSQRTEP